jgi:regulator of replication initiation timing
LPTLTAPASRQPEPTLRDILNAVTGLESQVGDLRSEVGGLKSEVGDLRSEVGELRTDMGALQQLASEQFSAVTKEIAKTRAECNENFEDLDRKVARLGEQTAEVRSDAAALQYVREHAAGAEMHSRQIHQTIRGMAAQVEECLSHSRDNRKLALKLQEDVARIDAKLDRHHADKEIHLPRPRTLGAPEAGPLAA